MTYCRNTVMISQTSLCFFFEQTAVNGYICKPFHHYCLVLKNLPRWYLVLDTLQIICRAELFSSLFCWLASIPFVLNSTCLSMDINMDLQNIVHHVYPIISSMSFQTLPTSASNLAILAFFTSLILRHVLPCICILLHVLLSSLVWYCI